MDAAGEVVVGYLFVYVLARVVMMSSIDDVLVCRESGLGGGVVENATI